MTTPREFCRTCRLSYQPGRNGLACRRLRRFQTEGLLTGVRGRQVPQGKGSGNARRGFPTSRTKSSLMCLKIDFQACPNFGLSPLRLEGG